jgi:hypothetical protein
VSEGHSLARDHKGRDKLREKKKANEQMRGTHFLESTKGGTSQNIIRQKVREGYSQTETCWITN